MAEGHPQVLAAPACFEKKNYTVFFSNISPSIEGEIGDLWLVCPESTHYNVFSQRTAENGSRLTVTEFGGKSWVKLINGWEEISETATSLSDIEHPQVKRVRLDLTRLNWRSKNSISSQLSRERKKRKTEGGEEKKKCPRVGPTCTSVAPQEYDSPAMRTIHDSEASSMVIPNSWVLPLLEEWNSVAKVKNVDPLVGREALQALLELPEVLDFRGRPNSCIVTNIHELICRKHPTRADISGEWLANHSRAQLVSCGESQAEGEHIRASAVQVSLCWGATEETELLSVIKLPDSLVVELRGLDVPEEMKERPGWVYHEREGGAKNAWHYTIVPGAGITFSHVDTWTGCTYISHFAGKKLWLFWPGTLENYRILYSDLLKGGDDRVSPATAIRGLSSLEVMLMDDTWRPCWVMAPGTIHCVMTFGLIATHSRFNFYSINDWEKSQGPSLAMVELIDESPVCGDGNASRWLGEMVGSLELWEKMESRDTALDSWLSILREKLKSACAKMNMPANEIQMHSHKKGTRNRKTKRNYM